jgi:hypothetical protein
MPMEPSLLNYFTSNHFILFAVRQIIVDRIAAVVSPRFPRPLTFIPTAFLRLPLIYWLTQNAVQLFLLTRPIYQKDDSIEPDTLSSQIAPVLFILYKLMCVTSVVEVFIRCLEHRNWSSASDYSANIFEWGIILHFQPSYHVAPIAFLHLCQLLTMQVLYLNLLQRVS